MFLLSTVQAWNWNDIQSVATEEKKNKCCRRYHFSSLSFFFYKYLLNSHQVYIAVSSLLQQIYTLLKQRLVPMEAEERREERERKKSNGATDLFTGFFFRCYFVRLMSDFGITANKRTKNQHRHIVLCGLLFPLLFRSR